ncbi:MAG: DUF3078 domain-containing protein [Alistipes sp.]|nr:DUF3078 domain-containing protein [Alistipes sp.]
MKKFYLTLMLVAFATTAAMAQVSVDDVNTESKQRGFENDMKIHQLDADYVSDAKLRADRIAKRKEHNTVDFTANLHGSLTAYSKSWQASGDNTVTVLANLNFLHTYNKGRFTLTNTATGKFGYNNMKMEIADEQRGVWFKNVDEIALSTSPQWALVKNWSYGANVKFRTQFAPGYGARGDKQKGAYRISNFMTPGYLDASLGFTYILPSEKFPLKVNLAPIAMSATYVNDSAVFWTLDGGVATKKDKAYGVPFGHKSKYEGGLSIQLDFDKTWGKDGWLRYRTTAYSFYGWITDISSQKKFVATADVPEYEHVVPTIRWENTIDIKATKHISTQIYFQLYYNKAELDKLQVSSMLSVGLTYTFKNK